jgi:monoamine oxidase
MAHSHLFRQFIRTFQRAHWENLKADGSSLPISIPKTGWTRRRLIKSVTLAAGGAIASSGLSYLEKAWGEGQPRIAIVGAGIAGLNAAYQLQKAGLRATVYEAKDQVGGRIQSVTGVVGPGLVSDLGGSLIDTDHSDILALVKEFQLPLFNRVKEAQRAGLPGVAYFFEGRLHPESEVADKLRAIAGQISRDAALLDRNFDRFAPSLDQMSVTDYLNKYADQIPDPFIRTLLEATIRSEYGVEPEASSALQLITNLPTVKGQKVEILFSNEEFVVRGGSGRIISRLANALSGQIQTRRELIRLQARSQDFRLTFRNGQTVDADFVILAIPFPVLRTINLQVTLPRRLRRFIDEGDLGLNEKLTAGFTSKLWRQPNGFGEDIWTDLGFNEAWDDSQRQLDRPDGALTFFMGGREVQAIQGQTAPMVGNQFIDRFDAAIPGAKAAANSRFLLTQWNSDRFVRGAYSSFRPGQLTAFSNYFYIESDNPNERQDVNVGNLIFAGEQLSDEFYGYMNGGAQTGRLAAEIIIRKMKG